MVDYFAWFRGYNLFLREWGNASLYPLMAMLVLMASGMLWRAYRENPVGWRAEPGVDFACVFVPLFLGEGLRAFGAWLALDAQREGRRLTPPMEDVASLMFLLGVGLLVYGAIRFILLLNAPHERGRSFLFVAVFVAAVLTAAELLT